MTILRITKHGEQVLKKPCPPVDYEKVVQDLPALLKDMWATMHAARGVGLAAPQIGLNLRMAVIDVKPEGKPQPIVLINPVILGKEGVQEEEEGCLSIPGLYSKLRRAAKVHIQALDEHGKKFEAVGEGLLARAFQHETDHLDGKLFIDHLGLAQRLKVAGILKDLKKTWD